MAYVVKAEEIREALRTARLRPAMGAHIARALGVPVTTVYSQLKAQHASVRDMVFAERERRFQAWCQSRGSLDELHEALGYVGISETRKFVRIYSGRTIGQWQRTWHRPEREETHHAEA